MEQHVYAKKQVTVGYKAEGSKKLLSFVFQESTKDNPVTPIDDALLARFMRNEKVKRYFDERTLTIVPASQAQSYLDGDPMPEVHIPAAQREAEKLARELELAKKKAATTKGAADDGDGGDDDGTPKPKSKASHFPTPVVGPKLQ